MRLRAWSSAEARPSASEWRAAAAAEMAWPSTEVTWRNSCSDSGASLRVPKLYSEMISRVWRVGVGGLLRAAPRGGGHAGGAFRRGGAGVWAAPAPTRGGKRGGAFRARWVRVSSARTWGATWRKTSASSETRERISGSVCAPAVEARHNRTTTPPGRTRTRIPLLYGGPDGAGAEVFNRLGECTRSLTECPLGPAQ